jgi:hypothetical protein
VPDQPQEPTQKTAKGLEIPVPKRGQILAALKKLSGPKKP